MPEIPFGLASAQQIFGAAKTLGTLPSQQGGGSAAEFSRADIQGLLTPPSINISDADVQKAMSPVATTAPLQMPASLTRQIRDPGPAPQDTRQVVGAGNARAQGIGNTISASIGALAQFKAARDQQKQEAQGQQVSRYIQAQQGLSQAQAVLAQDPQNKAALEAKQQNENLIKGMFQDPKFVKTLEKGFNISLTDPSQNKTPEHGIVQRGIDLFKKQSQQPFSAEQAQAMAQKFQAAQPKQLTANTMAQQALQAKQEQAKLQMDAYKERISLAKSMMDSTGKIDVERLKAGSQMQVAMFNADKALALEAARFGNEKYLAKYRNSLEIARDNMKRALDDKDVYQFMKEYDSNTKDYTEGMSKLNNDINTTLTEMHKSGITDADRAELRTNLDRLYQTQRALTQNHDTFSGLASKMLDIPAEQLRGDAPPQVGGAAAPGAGSAGAPAPTPAQGGGTSGFGTGTGQGTGLAWPSATPSGGGTPNAPGQQPASKGPDFQQSNPFTGREYPKDFPTADKYLLGALYDASKVSASLRGEAEAASEELQSGAESVQDWFDKLPADLKSRIPKPPRERGPA